MQTPKYVILMLVAVWASGCSWLMPGKPYLEEEGAPYVSSGKIVDEGRLKEGGELVIVPFKAGPGVPANKELDQASLMVVKGIAEALQDNAEEFNVVFNDEAQYAELIIQGHVTELKKPSFLKRWFLMRRKKSLAIRGKLIDRDTGEVVAVFSDRGETNKALKDIKAVSYSVGQNIGHFLVTGLF